MNNINRIKRTRKIYNFRYTHTKNNFVDVSKIIQLNTDLKIILLERLNVDNKAAKSFNILAISLNVLHNYF